MKENKEDQLKLLEHKYNSYLVDLILKIQQHPDKINNIKEICQNLGYPIAGLENQRKGSDNMVVEEESKENINVVPEERRQPESSSNQDGGSIFTGKLFA